MFSPILRVGILLKNNPWTLLQQLSGAIQAMGHWLTPGDNIFGRELGRLAPGDAVWHSLAHLAGASALGPRRDLATPVHSSNAFYKSHSLIYLLIRSIADGSGLALLYYCFSKCYTMIYSAGWGNVRAFGSCKII